jgi:hypothetical protein
MHFGLRLGRVLFIMRKDCINFWWGWYNLGMNGNSKDQTGLMVATTLFGIVGLIFSVIIDFMSIPMAIDFATDCGGTGCGTGGGAVIIFPIFGARVNLPLLITFIVLYVIHRIKIRNTGVFLKVLALLNLLAAIAWMIALGTMLGGPLKMLMLV